MLNLVKAGVGAEDGKPVLLLLPLFYPLPKNMKVPSKLYFVVLALGWGMGMGMGVKRETETGYEETLDVYLFLVLGVPFPPYNYYNMIL
jgi:hypothetical protein